MFRTAIVTGASRGIGRAVAIHAHKVLTELVASLRNGAGANSAEATRQVNDWFGMERTKKQCFP
jgi:NAD(P)-dependent dehydrogenase (short-subunit alcohol dehydrogenase family)